MKIYSMTATFGKLEHQTLTLTPGLNIIHAPNEWGKSTWCAFLVAMLYGVDTRAKSTKNALTEKERYLPWSGSPMEGRIDLNWNGIDITIQRRTKGRVPLGEFQAYETKTGVMVPELTAANCGQQLLGVERSVFLRAGFIRLTDLPVTNDHALLQRLNALVSTGDENVSGEKLAQSIKDLKNRCRYHRNGLIPQAEEERTDLQERIRERSTLEEQLHNLKERLAEVEHQIAQLENHLTALEYTASQANIRLVSEAQSAQDAAQKRLEEAKILCAQLPDPDYACDMLEQIQALQQEKSQLEAQMSDMLQEPKKLEIPEMFSGMTGKQAIRKTWDDRDLYYSLYEKGRLMMVLGALLAFAGVGIACFFLFPGLACAGAGLITLLAAVLFRSRSKRRARTLESKYGGPDPENWAELAEYYAEEYRNTEAAEAQYQKNRKEFALREEALEKRTQELLQEQSLEEAHIQWQRTVDLWSSFTQAQEEYLRQTEHANALLSMARPTEAPKMPDGMDFSEEETLRQLSESRQELHMLQNRIGQYQGRMEVLGSKDEMEQRLTQVNHRIAKLEDTYAALSIAQETLAEASAELQRRFAPRISQRAQELMSQLTDGRYDKVLLGNDFALRASAQQEDTLHDVLWRSDGTIDQLYLALRLAVAEALTERAPLILDDVLVRFDDKRMASALGILKEMSKEKQVILFTCQSREKDAAQI